MVLFDIGVLGANPLDFPTFFLKSGDELLCGRIPKPGKERHFLTLPRKPSPGSETDLLKVVQRQSTDTRMVSGGIRSG